MFRRWPFFQRLLSWTKPHAPAPRGTRAYERYDWNSLLGEEPEAARASSPSSWTAPRTSRRARRWRPTSRRSRERAGLDDPLRLPLDRDAPVERRPGRRAGSSSRRPTASTAPRSLVVAVGVAQPYTPPGPGMEHTHHYADVRAGRDLRRPAGVHHRQAELRVRAGQRAPAVGAPARARVAVARASCRSRRARSSASGRATSSRTRTTSWAAAWRSSTPRIDRHRAGAGGRRLTVAPATDRRRRRPRARGRRRHLGDRVRLPAPGSAGPGVATFGASRLPARRRGGRARPSRASSSRARSARRPRASRSTASRPTRGRSTGRATTPGSSPATSRRRGSASSRARPADRARRTGRRVVATELAEAPELLHQRGYLARVFTADPDGGLRRRRRPAAEPTSSTPAARTRSRSPSRPTAPGRSTRSCTRGRRARSPSSDRPGPAAALRRAATRVASRRGLVRRVVRRASLRPRGAQAVETGAGPAAPRPPASVSSRLGNANRSFVRPSSGSREERRARHGRDARVGDEPVGEGHVVLARSGRGCRS